MLKKSLNVNPELRTEELCLDNRLGQNVWPQTEDFRKLEEKGYFVIDVWFWPCHFLFRQCCSNWLRLLNSHFSCKIYITKPSDCCKSRFAAYQGTGESTAVRKVSNENHYLLFLSGIERTSRTKNINNDKKMKKQTLIMVDRWYYT